jgi:dTDP-4-dehydrorhamnose 3,5-epimerase
VENLKFFELPLKGSYTIELEKIEDKRGFFARYWCQNEISKIGLDTNIVQINNSVSKTKGTIRGLHFQRPPKAETKIIRCIKGYIWDVIVDIRLESPTYGKWYGYELSEENRTMMYVPKGFAHGFQTLVDDVELIYLHSEFYSKNNEAGLFYNDKDIAIDWPLSVTETTSRDESHPKLRDIKPIKL